MFVQAWKVPGVFMIICMCVEWRWEQSRYGLVFQQRLALPMPILPVGGISAQGGQRPWCTGWAPSPLSTWYGLLMICPPLHLSGWSRFTPQPLGPFSFDIGAKHQWIYKKQLTESYLWHPFLFFTASAVQKFFPYFYFSFAVMSSDSGSLTQTTLSGFPPPPSSVFFVCLANCYLLTENYFSELYLSNSGLQVPKKANEHWCLDCNTRHLPQS